MDKTREGHKNEKRKRKGGRSDAWALVLPRDSCCHTRDRLTLHTHLIVLLLDL